MTDRELMQQALEALENTTAEWRALADSGDAGFWKAEDQDDYKQCVAAITALRTRLAQPEQEPVSLNNGRLTQYPDGSIGVDTPAKPDQWQGLTEDEKNAMVEWAHPDIIEAIELKLRERNT